MGSASSQLVNACRSSTSPAPDRSEAAVEVPSIAPRVLEGAPSDSGQEMEVSSQTLENSEENSLQQEVKEGDHDDDGEEDGSEDAETSTESEDESTESSTSDSSESSGEDWEKPSTNPWRRFSDIASAMEPWNRKFWHGLTMPLKMGFSWSSIRSSSDQLRCSLIYASVMLRSYRRKCVRFVNTSLAARNINLNCPKRPLRQTVSTTQDL